MKKSVYTPLDEALDKYTRTLLSCGMNPQTECISVANSAGYITGKPVYAKICAPHYNACAMDGIATLSSITVGASENNPVLLTQEQFVRVDTGDLLPEKFDCVVMVEDCEFENNSVMITAPSTPWKHVRVIGEDVCAGEMILTSHSQITPSALGVLIAAGVTEIYVVKKPVVGFIPTGDEIVSPVPNPKPGEILEFNSAIISAMLTGWGAEPVIYPIVRDNKKLIIDALKKALKECDIILLGAGASKGREDYSAAAIAEVAKISTQGIAMKPGKPTILAYKENKPVIGMPGYPVSGIIVMEQIVQPLLNYLACRIPPEDKYSQATLIRPISSSPGFHEFTRVKLGYVKDTTVAAPISGGSGVVTSFMKADGIVEVPLGVDGYKSGDIVKVRLLKNEDELKKSIVVIGSHDPLLDEINDMLCKQGMYLISSTNTGSMQGIYAVKKGEAHIAGLHLLDEKTGEYNKSFVKKNFPEGGVKLINLVKRKQGLLVKKGNPKGIKSVSDLTKKEVRFVNRQKGSGTRILFDYLCCKEKVDTSLIYGYETEVCTHASIAAMVVSGTVDSGLGIYMASNMYDLDFLHICDESYDLLIADHAMELPSVKALLDVIASEEFKKRVNELGGYIINQVL